MSSILRVSDAASLALHAMAVLAARPGGPVPVKEIAALLGASKAHLMKVLQRLAKSGLVRATRGPAGGYELAGRPEKITLKRVYEVIEGPLSITTCLFGKPVCNGQCILGDLLQGMGERVRDRLAHTTVSDVSGVFAKKGGK